MWNEWRFFAQVLPEFGHPVPTLCYQNRHGVNLAMLVFNVNNRAAYLVVRKKGHEDAKEENRSFVTGKVRLLPVFTPLPPDAPSPRQLYLPKTFNETETSYSLGMGPVVENSYTVHMVTHLIVKDRFFLLNDTDETVFEIEAKVDREQAHAFLAFCAP